MPKICVICNEDCSDRPRTKDEQGRYACKACVEARKQHSQPHAHNEPEVAPAPVPDDGIYQVAGSEGDWIGAAPKLCPGCGGVLAQGAIICTRCGYDDRKGVQHNTGVESSERGPLCKNCGYDLKGLRSGKCPECGERNRPASNRDAQRAFARDAARMEYIRPALYLAAGAIGVVIIQLARGNPSVLIALPVGLLIMTAAGVVAFYAMSLIVWVFDAPFGLIAIRLAGIFALCELAQTIFVLMGLPWIAWAARVLIQYGLIMSEFDVDDWREVWGMTILMQVMSFGVLLGLAAIL